MTSHKELAQAFLQMAGAGKVVELWDLGQLIDKNSPNENGSF